MSPISPKAALAAKRTIIPKAVFDVFDNLLKERAAASTVTITQAEVLAALGNMSHDEIFAKHWLDVESSYEKVGWKVEYDKPGYNEDYEPFWTFKVRNPK